MVLGLNIILFNIVLYKFVHLITILLKFSVLVM